MNIKLRRGWLIAVTVPLVLLLGIWVFGYHLFEFRGGMGIHDSGFLSYPRYHAELGRVALWKPSENTFTVRGLPPNQLDLVLQVLDATQQDVPELSDLSTVISISIVDSSGKELCTASGSLSDAKKRGVGGWVLTSSSTTAAFWHPRCQQLPISRFKTYTVRVRISDVDARSTQRTIIPVLQGGGNELP